MYWYKTFVYNLQISIIILHNTYWFLAIMKLQKKREIVTFDLMVRTQVTRRVSKVTPY